MFDVKNARQFLKRQEAPTVALEDFYVGANITILSRMLRIMDYGDVHTRRYFETARQRTFAMIKPDCYAQMGSIISAIQSSGLQVNKLKMSRFNRDSAEAFYAEHKGKPFFPNL